MVELLRIYNIAKESRDKKMFYLKKENRHVWVFSPWLAISPFLLLLRFFPFLRSLSFSSLYLLSFNVFFFFFFFHT